MKTGFTTFSLLLLLALSFPRSSDANGELRRFGLLGGLSFPKLVLAKADLNISNLFALDYEFSLGLFWSIQELDALYFFSRGEWSPYIGVALENWNFFGFSSSTNYAGVVFGNGSQAVAVSVPVGLLFVGDGGFAFELGMAGDIFTNAPMGLQWKVIPEAEVAAGYFF